MSTPNPTRLQLRQLRRSTWRTYKAADTELTREEFDQRVLAESPQLKEMPVGNPLVMFLLSIAWELFKYWLKKKLSKSAIISHLPNPDEPDYDAYKAASIN